MTELEAVWKTNTGLPQVKAPKTQLQNIANFLLELQLNFILQFWARQTLINPWVKKLQIPLKNFFYCHSHQHNSKTLIVGFKIQNAHFVTDMDIFMVGDDPSVQDKERFIDDLAMASSKQKIYLSKRISLENAFKKVFVNKCICKHSIVLFKSSNFNAVVMHTCDIDSPLL